MARFHTSSHSAGDSLSAGSVLFCWLHFQASSLHTVWHGYQQLQAFTFCGLSNHTLCNASHWWGLTPLLSWAQGRGRALQPARMIPQRRRDILSTEEEMLNKQNNRCLILRFFKCCPMKEDCLVHVAMSSGAEWFWLWISCEVQQDNWPGL